MPVQCPGAPAPSPLSHREDQILTLAADGLTDREIAERLGIGLPTIKSYWIRIRHKVGGHNRTETVARSLRHPEHGVGGMPDALADWWRTMCRYAPWVVVVVDRNGTIVHLSRPPLRVGAACMVGRSLRDVCTPAFRDLVAARFTEVVEKGEARELRAMFEVREGKTMELAGRLAPLESHGTVAGVLFFVEQAAVARGRPTRRRIVESQA